MSVRFDGDTVALPDQGLVIHPVTLALHDARKSQPPPANAVWLVLRGPNGDLYWEQGEWQGGEGMFDRGWYFIGGDQQIEDADFEVLLWCHEPPVPRLDKLGVCCDET